uniref:Vesicular, overexpressed in cancer, prosurvival protein 1 n=1 Tax=Ciona savignyi TaxID=51511 RepID=H2YXC6_CIOSA
MNQRFLNLKIAAFCSFWFVFCIDFGESRVSYSSSDTRNIKQENCNGSDGQNYVCEVGHCCDGDSCCTYYYELWWFWLIWGMIILMSCCCAYHHRQKRRLMRNQRRRSHGNGGENYAGVCNYPGPPLDNDVLGYAKLPLYDDVIRIPPSGSPPPPYS